MYILENQQMFDQNLLRHIYLASVDLCKCLEQTIREKIQKKVVTTH